MKNVLQILKAGLVCRHRRGSSTRAVVVASTERYFGVFDMDASNSPVEAVNSKLEHLRVIVFRAS